ncbi:MAG: hypothetical protein AB1916_02150 [Thermodesulfobacteriota bacterium]
MHEASLAKRWLALALCALCCWAMMFVVLPAVNRAFPAMGRLAAVIEDKDIRTGMFFYTDVEVSGAANLNMENTMRFMPRGGPKAEKD